MNDIKRVEHIVVEPENGCVCVREGGVIHLCQRKRECGWVC